MHPKSPKWLKDVANACAHITEWTAGVTLVDYEGHALPRAAVERRFEIIGEALPRLELDDPETAARVSQRWMIIGSLGGGHRKAPRALARAGGGAWVEDFGAVGTPGIDPTWGAGPFLNGRRFDDGG